MIDVAANVAGVAASLRRGAVAADQWRAVWADLEQPWYRSRAELVMSRGAAAGGVFLYSPRYLAAKARITGTRPGDAPMAWPGRVPLLLRSLTAAGPLTVMRPIDDTLDVGSRAPQAAALIRGGDPLPGWAGPGTVPRYPLLSDTARWRSARQAAIDHHAARVADVVEGGSPVAATSGRAL